MEEIEVKQRNLAQSGEEGGGGAERLERIKVCKKKGEKERKREREEGEDRGKRRTDRIEYEIQG